MPFSFPSKKYLLSLKSSIFMTDRSLIFCRPPTFLSRYHFFTPSLGLRVRQNCEVLTWPLNKGTYLIHLPSNQLQYRESIPRVIALRNPNSITCLRPHLQRYLHPGSFLPFLLVTCGIPSALCSVVSSTSHSWLSKDQGVLLSSQYVF